MLDNQKIDGKSFITVIYEDKENRVTWFSDTPHDDVRFAILCACDALVDGEFEILDDRAKIINLESVKSFKTGSTYFLRKTNNSKPSNILLDGNRKLSVQIEPLSHIESQVAIKYMLVGSNLLKQTRNGYPHIRMFQLSHDLKRILWYTKSKNISESQISFDNITDIVVGQTSENFVKYPLKMLEEFSFSIYYKKDSSVLTLDLTCKDEREFDLWVIGLKALHCRCLGKVINKNTLLSHCKSFKEQINKGNIGQSSKFLFYEFNDVSSILGQKEIRRLETPKGKKNLDKFINSRNLTQSDVASLLVKIFERCKALSQEVQEVTNSEEFSTGLSKNEYQMVFAEEAIVDDLDTQKNQMIKLFKNSEEALGKHIQEFLWFTKEHKLNMQYNIDEDDFDEFMKVINTLETILQMSFSGGDDNFNPEKINLEYFIREMDIKLWKIEIDLENVGDIVNRFKAPKDKGFLEVLKNILRIFK